MGKLIDDEALKHEMLKTLDFKKKYTPREFLYCIADAPTACADVQKVLNAIDKEITNAKELLEKGNFGKDEWNAEIRILEWVKSLFEGKKAELVSE